MRNTVAKRLRQAALTEMLGDGVPKRELVMGRNSVVNSPQSVRAMYLQLKAAWTHRHDQQPKPLATRVRPPSGWHVPAKLGQAYTWIASPLKQLRRLFPGTTSPAGVFEPHPVMYRAQDLASLGDGAGLQRLARHYL